MATRSISEQVQGLKQQNAEFNLRRLVVAHDSSQASERALRDAIFLAKRFHSEILLAHVQALTDEPTHEENAQGHADLEPVTSRLAGMAYGAGKFSVPELSETPCSISAVRRMPIFCCSALMVMVPRIARPWDPQRNTFFAPFLVLC